MFQQRKPDAKTKCNIDTHFHRKNRPETKGKCDPDHVTRAEEQLTLTVKFDDRTAGMTDTLFVFDNSYARTLDGFYAPWRGDVAPAPRFLKLNQELAEELGLDADRLNGHEGLRILSGSHAPEGAQPLAQAYAGHQFGGFSPQLGDGRALLIGEVIDRNGRRRDIHLKGSGRTPF